MTESYGLRPVAPEEFGAVGEVLSQAFNEPVAG